ncbi:MAG: pyridoxal phosphate-dependent aminotransferase [Clostridia bacterium]|nr:pyridoxal phosphate-dependent aminotransferase [Clostridia bacterium]
MAERNLDFDKGLDRKGTDSIKFDYTERFHMPEDVLSYWVADMDFPTSSYVQDAVIEAVQKGAFGYTLAGDDYFDAVAGWMLRHHDLKVEPEWLVQTPGVVFGLAHGVRAYTEPGDTVLIQEPVYYPFANVIRHNDRKVVSNDLVLREDGTYGIDFEDFETKLKEDHPKLFILCSPHNPVGRVWIREELKTLGDLCKQYGVLVLADEIHSDLTFGATHTSFFNVDPSFQEFSLLCTAPSKTFNLAGLQTSNLFIPNKSLRNRFRKELDRSGAGQPNQLGLIACKAAYTHGEEWYDALIATLSANLDFAVDFINTRSPGLRALKPEGTYLLWVDCRRLGLSGKELDRFIREEAKLWLDGGTMFGPTGEGFQRINVATSREYLQKGLEQLEAAVLRKERQ